MVAEQHVFVGRHEVQAVVALHRRGGAGRVQPEHLVGDEQPVIAVGHQVDRDRGDHDPQRIDALAAAQGHGAEGEGADDGQQAPGGVAGGLAHADGSRFEVRRPV